MRNRDYRIGIVPSLNGYGHLRRCLSIARQLKIRGFRVTVIWDTRIGLPKWAKVFALENYIEFDFVLSPLFLDGPYVRRDLSDTGGEVCRLKGFDCLIADTVTWPLRDQDKSVLLAQFTWDIYNGRVNRMHPNFEFSTTLPDSTNIFSMSLFIWEEMRQLKNLTEIPVLDYWNLSLVRYPRSKTIVYSPSGVRNLTSEQLAKLVQTQIEVVRGLENFVRISKERPLAVVCRAGLGALTECLSLKSMPLFIPDPDLEINRNMSITIERGVGLLLDEVSSCSEMELKSIIDLRYNAANWPKVISVESFVHDYLLEVV
jgi:hypothetical protein